MKEGSMATPKVNTEEPILWRRDTNMGAITMATTYVGADDDLFQDYIHLQADKKFSTRYKPDNKWFAPFYLVEDGTITAISSIGQTSTATFTAGAIKPNFEKWWYRPIWWMYCAWRKLTNRSR